MRLFFLFLFMSCMVSSLSAQQGEGRLQRHELAQSSSTEQFRYPGMVEQLKAAIASEDIGAMIYLQKELLSFIRHFNEQPENAGCCRQTLESFEGFSFHNADAAARDLKMKLLEEIQQLIAP